MPKSVLQYKVGKFSYTVRYTIRIDKCEGKSRFFTAQNGYAVQYISWEYLILLPVSKKKKSELVWKFSSPHGHMWHILPLSPPQTQYTQFTCMERPNLWLFSLLKWALYCTARYTVQSALEKNTPSTYVRTAYNSYFVSILKS